MERPDQLHLGDIEGATARPPHARSTVFGGFNSNADIDGSKPNHMSSLGRFKVSTRLVDPLNPQYNLPSYTYHQVEEPRGQPRELLWTLNQPKWRPEPRAEHKFSDAELYHRSFLYRRDARSRDIMMQKDITGPQFMTEAPRTRHTDPLTPAYRYDGGPVDTITTHVPRYGSRYVRKPHEDTSLMTKDIAKSEYHMGGMYPKELIKTREANRTSDIEGARADTKPLYPRIWTMPGKTPEAVPEKETNKVWDIYGAVAGTAGQGLPLYRSRKQTESETRMAASAPSAQLKLRMASSDRAADIAAVAALK